MSARTSFFSSDRERQLWFLVWAVVVAIWSTLGVAGALVERLRDRNLLDAAFVAGFVVLLACIGLDALGRRPRGREIWVGLAIVAVYGMVVVRMGIPLEERTHLFEYGLVAILVHRALRERRRGGRRVPAAPLTAAVITACLGWLDEGIQGLLPNRVYDIRDIGFNALAGLMTILASLALEWVGRRSRQH